MIIQLIFWISVGMIVYVYIGYPLLLALFTTFYSSGSKRNNFLACFSTNMPIVSLIIPARNEEISIRSKIENSLALDYPEDKLEIIVVSDGSTDRTNVIVSEYTHRNVKLVELQSHSGKSSAQNAGIKQSKGEIIVFSDATGIYSSNAIKSIVMRFSDPRVGCVTGKLLSQKESARRGAGTASFRNYERFIRAKESILGNLVVATGSIFAIRRSLFQPLNPQHSDDFIFPLRTAQNKYRVVQELSATSVDDVNPLGSVFRRRRQVISKDFRTLMSMKEMLNPFKFPLVAWGLFSHKLLRWLGGLFLFTSFIMAGLLIDNIVFLSVFILQIISFLFALLGWFLRNWNLTPRFIMTISNFYISNLAALVGITDHLRGKKTGVWEPART